MSLFGSIIGLLSLILASLALWQIHSLNRLKKSFFAGKNASDLEVVLQGLVGELKSLQEEHTVLENTLTDLQNQLNFAVQKIGLVRFNPFEDAGGNFSFSIALLNAKNDGIIITSMHGRQQNRVYTKQIENGQSKITLTEEEQQAITKAKNTRLKNFSGEKQN